jgi:hypothetical protein
MITSILDYSQSVNAPGVVKSLSNPSRIDQAYLTKIIEASKGDAKKEAPKKIGININFKKGGDKGSKTSDTAVGQQVVDQAKVNEKLAALTVEGYSDDEDEKIDEKTQVSTNVEFYRKQSETLKAAADKIERAFSLNKAVQEDKIPELMKRKTSMQQNLEFEMGGIQKIREAKEQEWDRPQDIVKGQTEEGDFFEITSPAVPRDAGQKKLAVFRQNSFNELYELEIPYEGRPKSKATTQQIRMNSGADDGLPEEETKE